MNVSVANIYRLGIKELWSLVRDPMMLVLIFYTFTVSMTGRHCRRASYQASTRHISKPRP